jgi:hypothetical protein
MELAKGRQTSMSFKPDLCLDFDGVIHSYKSGWKGPRVIPDPPVPGAINFLIEATKYFRVSIFSSRSRYLFGRRAMRQWLMWHVRNSSMLPDERKRLQQIKWPTFKPGAFVSIDDRCLTFTGKWPSMQDLRTFRPWNKQ